MTLEWLVQTDGSVEALILRLTLACRDTSCGDCVCCSDPDATHVRRYKGGICVDTITSCKTQPMKPRVTRTHVETTRQTGQTPL
jgi:hypothetical protein